MTLCLLSKSLTASIKHYLTAGISVELANLDGRKLWEFLIFFLFNAEFLILNCPTRQIHQPDTDKAFISTSLRENNIRGSN